MHQNLFATTPKTLKTIAVAIFYNFFLHDPDNFPGFGYDSEQASCTYADGCAVGCLLPREITEPLDTIDSNGGMIGQAVTRLPADVLRRFGLNPKPTVDGELSFSPDDVEIIGLLSLCQKIHDECADISYETQDGTPKAVAQFKSRLLSLFEARFGHSSHGMAAFRDRAEARRLLTHYLNPEVLNADANSNVG